MFANKITSFDIIFSLGDACSCTETLRLANLQNYTYPFDWLLDGDFSLRANILLNDFDTWFEKKDLKLVDSYKKNHVYTNQKTNITYIHDFYNDLSFDEAYSQVSNKYKRREERLLTSLKHAKTALLVYVNSPNKEMINNNDLKNISKKLQVKYENTIINILYFYNVANISPDKAIIKKIDGNITKIIFDYNAYSENFAWEINRDLLLPFLSTYKLN